MADQPDPVAQQPAQEADLQASLLAYKEDKLSAHLLAAQDDRLDKREKYINWTQRMERRLRSANLWGYISGSTPSGAQPSEQWLLRDQRVQDFIFRHLADNRCHLVHGCTTAAAMWERLRQKYAGRQRTDQLMLMNEWAAIAMETATETLQQYQERVHKMAQKRQLIGVPINEHDQVMQFIRGLPKDDTHVAIGMHIVNTPGDLTWETVDAQIRYFKMLRPEPAKTTDQSGVSGCPTAIAMQQL